MKESDLGFYLALRVLQNRHELKVAETASGGTAERLRKLIREAVYDATLATHSGDMEEVRRILNKLRDEADK